MADKIYALDLDKGEWSQLLDKEFGQPRFRADQICQWIWQKRVFDAAEMTAYFDMLPEKLGKLKLRHAIEVRHASFTDEAFLKIARERNIAVVTVESEKHPLIVEPTADFSYARLELTQADEPTGYAKPALKKWAKTARDWEKSGEVFLYFISGAKERNPAAAMAMLDLLKA